MTQVLFLIFFPKKTPTLILLSLQCCFCQFMLTISFMWINLINSVKSSLLKCYKKLFSFAYMSVLNIQFYLIFLFGVLLTCLVQLFHFLKAYSLFCQYSRLQHILSLCYLFILQSAKNEQEGIKVPVESVSFNLFEILNITLDQYCIFFGKSLFLI